MKNSDFPRIITDLLDRNHIVYRIISHEKVVTMSDVSRELGIPYGSMVKTLVVRTSNGCIGVALPGDKRLSLTKLASVLQLDKSSICFLPKTDFKSTVGVQVGATSPFGIGLSLIVDQGLANQDMIYCGCGTLTETISIRFSDLLKISNAIVGDIVE